MDAFILAARKLKSKPVIIEIASDPIVARDARLIENDYEPLAAVGKIPAANGWQKRPNTVAAIAAERAAHPDAISSGLRTGRFVAFDVDLSDPGHAIEVEQIIADNLGETPLRRVGSKGFLLGYQNDTPIKKINIGSKDKRQVEILGVGQQFIAYGIHPDTGRSYTWTNDLTGGEPLVTPLADLPKVTPDAIYKVAHLISERLTALGYAGVTVSGIKSTEDKPPSASSAGVPFTPAQLTEMLSYLDPDCPRDEWRDIAAALHAAPCTVPDFDKRDLFVRWSRGEVRQ